MVRGSAVVLAFLAASRVTADDDKLNVLSLLSSERWYVLDRVRWAEQRRTGAYQQSGEMFKHKKVETPIGTIEVPIEDPVKLQTLSPSERELLLGSPPSGPLEDEQESMLAQALLEEGEVDEAIAILEGVRDRVEMDFGTQHCLFASALADLGQAHFHKQHWEEAAALFQRAAVIDEMTLDKVGPHNYAASANMFVLSSLKAGQVDVFEKSSILEAIFRALLASSDPERYKILVNLGQMYRDFDMPIRSIAVLKLARNTLVRDHPARKDLSLQLGMAYQRLGEFESARRLLDVAKAGFEASGESEKYFDCLYQLAQVQLLQHQFGEALSALTQLKTNYENHFPENYKQSALIVCAIAQCLLGMGQVEQAIMFFNAAESLASQDADTNMGLIELRIAYYLTKAYDENGGNRSEQTKTQHERRVELEHQVLGGGASPIPK